jgi:hypothetical protein
MRRRVALACRGLGPWFPYLGKFFVLFSVIGDPVFLVLTHLFVAQAQV